MHRVTLSGIIASDQERLIPSPILPPMFGLKEVATALASGGDVVFAIDSYGGSVEEASRIGIAIRDAVANGASVSYEVGACAFSAAANLIATAPRGVKVLVHPETSLMFHSCYGAVVGSPDTIRDAADGMEKYNETVIQALLQKTNLRETAIREFFQAGREGWMTGAEAVECGLADGYADGMVTTDLPAVIDSRQFPLAAFCLTRYSLKKKGENPMPEEIKEELVPEEVLEEKAEEKTEPCAECGECEEKKCEGVGEVPVEENPSAEDAPSCLPAEQPAEEPSPAVDEEKEALKARVAELEKELESLKALKGGLSVKASASAPRKDFAQLVKEIPAGISPSEYAKRFHALKVEHKQEYDSYMKAHSTRY